MGTAVVSASPCLMLCARGARYQGWCLLCLATQRCCCTPTAAACCWAAACALPPAEGAAGPLSSAGTQPEKGRSLPAPCGADDPHAAQTAAPPDHAIHPQPHQGGPQEAGQAVGLQEAGQAVGLAAGRQQGQPRVCWKGAGDRQRTSAVRAPDLQISAPHARCLLYIIYIYLSLSGDSYSQ